MQKPIGLEIAIAANDGFIPISHWFQYWQIQTASEQCPDGSKWYPDSSKQRPDSSGRRLDGSGRSILTTHQPHRPVDEPCTSHIGRTGLNIQHAPAVSCMDYCCPFSPL